MKRIFKTMLFCMMMLILTGCMKINASFKVLENCHYNFYMTLLLSESAYNNINLDVDTLKEIIIDETKLNSDNIKEFSKTINGAKYLGYEIRYNHKSADNTDHINVSLSDDKKEITFVIDKPTFGNDFINLDALGNGKDAMKVLKDNGMEITVRIEMPGKITYASKGTVNNDIVTIDLLEDELDGIVVTSKINNYYIPMAILLAGIGALMYIFHHYSFHKEG